MDGALFSFTHNTSGSGSREESIQGICLISNGMKTRKSKRMFPRIEFAITHQFCFTRIVNLPHRVMNEMYQEIMIALGIGNRTWRCPIHYHAVLLEEDHFRECLEIIIIKDPGRLNYPELIFCVGKDITWSVDEQNCLLLLLLVIFTGTLFILNQTDLGPQSEGKCRESSFASHLPLFALGWNHGNVILITPTVFPY